MWYLPSDLLLASKGETRAAGAPSQAFPDLGDVTGVSPGLKDTWSDQRLPASFVPLSLRVLKPPASSRHLAQWFFPGLAGMSLPCVASEGLSWARPVPALRLSQRWQEEYNLQAREPGVSCVVTGDSHSIPGRVSGLAGEAPEVSISWKLWRSLREF